MGRAKTLTRMATFTSANMSWVFRMARAATGGQTVTRTKANLRRAKSTAMVFGLSQKTRRATQENTEMT